MPDLGAGGPALGVGYGLASSHPKSAASLPLTLVCPAPSSLGALLVRPPAPQCTAS